MHDKAKLYYIMEYCPNGDLSDYIKKTGNFQFKKINIQKIFLIDKDQICITNIILQKE